MKARTARRLRTLPQIFSVPIALGVLSAIGLIGALVGDGPWDAVGWVGLGVPLAVALWFSLRPRSA